MESSGEGNQTVLHGLHNSKSIQLTRTDRWLPFKTSPLYGPSFPASVKSSGPRGLCSLLCSVYFQCPCQTPLYFTVSLLSAQNTKNYIVRVFWALLPLGCTPLSSCYFFLCGFCLICFLPLPPPHSLVLAEQNIWVILGRQTYLCYFIVFVIIL